MRVGIGLMSPRGTADRWVLWSSALLLCWGWIMVGSSSMALADQLFHRPFYFVQRQTLWCVLACVAAGWVWHVPLHAWKRHARTMVVWGGILLVLVWVPGIGHTVNGSARWLRVGPWSLQPSEWIKFAAVVHMAACLDRHDERMLPVGSGWLYLLAWWGLVGLLLLKEPDFGSTLVLSLWVVGMLFLGRLPLKQFVILVECTLLGLVVFALSSPYRLARLTAFLDPWADQFNTGYQLTQALIAWGRGGWWGVGLGQSVQKWFYLPEAHTDFVLAVLSEECGLVGVLVVLAAYSMLVGRAFVLGCCAERQGAWFAAYVAYGVGLWMGIQTWVNLGVNVGLLPTKGLTLPLMSYGGNSLLSHVCAVGLLLRVGYEVNQAPGRRGRA